jgi:tetratricopeptide (TPR) repeat protein
VWQTGTLVTVLADRGRFEEADSSLQGLLARADDLKQVILQGVARYAAAYLSLRRQDPSSAYPLLAEALRLSGPTQSRSARLLVGAVLAESLAALGRLDEAQEGARAHLELAREAGAMREQVRALRVLADVALAKGDPAAALGLADEAIALHQDRVDPIEQGRTLVVRSSIQLGLGDSEAARGDLFGAQAIFERIGALPDLEQTRRQSASFSRG